jgi:hypothetical protein
VNNSARPQTPRMRDLETIDAELRLVVGAWRLARVLNDRIPSTTDIDELLDERSATLSRVEVHSA